MAHDFARLDCGNLALGFLALAAAAPETEHLVLWGWNPGGRREPVPLPHKDLIEQMKVRGAGGAACPL